MDILINNTSHVCTISGSGKKGRMPLIGKPNVQLHRGCQEKQIVANMKRRLKKHIFDFDPK